MTSSQTGRPELLMFRISTVNTIAPTSNHTSRTTPSLNTRVQEKGGKHCERNRVERVSGYCRENGYRNERKHEESCREPFGYPYTNDRDEKRRTA